MPEVITHALIWNAKESNYVFQKPQEPLPLPVPAQEQWFAWLATHNAFAFRGRNGDLLLRQEDGDAGWYASRSQNEQTIQRYVGGIIDLTPERLEELAGEITLAFSSAEQLLERSVLLTAKMRLPQLHTSLLSRDHLQTKLDRCLEHKLTLLCAPAGSGKTTLVRQWIAQQESQPHFPALAWVSLDSGDNDPVRFWHYILTACQPWFPPDEQHALTMLLASTQTTMQSPSLEHVLTTFLNQVSQEHRQSLLILEDYHLITEKRIQETLAFLLAYLPETLHILILTRHTPPLPLVRLRANGDLHEILAPDLRFSQAETASFFAEYALSDTTIVHLDTQLEGWAAGLRLLLLSLQGQKSQAQIENLLTKFNGQHHSILEYFVLEVLQAQTASTQDFLLHTSMFERLNPSLCEAVTGNRESVALLQSLAKANLFVEVLEGEGNWYRYHALFAEAMQHEARRVLSEGEQQTLARKASYWFEEHHLFTEAIEASLKAQEWDHAARMIEKSLNPIIDHWRDTQEHYTHRRWFEQLPEAVIKAYPGLCLQYAIALVFGHEPQQQEEVASEMINELLRHAEHCWQEEKNQPCLGRVLAFRSFISHQFAPREEARHLAEQALALLDKTDYTWRALSLNTLGGDAVFQGRLSEGKRIYQQVGVLFEKIGSLHGQAMIQMMQTMIALGQGELRQLSHYAQLMSESETPISVLGFFFLAYVAYERNELAMVRQYAKEAERQVALHAVIFKEFLGASMSLIDSFLLHAQGETQQAIRGLEQVIRPLLAKEELQVFYQELFGWLVRFSLLIGDLASAHYWLDAFQADGELPPFLDQDTRMLTRQKSSKYSTLTLENQSILSARILIAEGEIEHALALLTPLLSITREEGRCGHLLQIQLLMAQAYAIENKHTESRQLLLEVLQYGYREGYQRFFIDEGKHLLPLLYDLLPSIHFQDLHDYTQNLIRAFQPVADQHLGSSVFSTLFEPLTAPEQHVLRLLVAGLSNADIARERIVSVNTVRTQLQSIYRKLNVNDRRAAVEAARRLNLL